MPCLRHWARLACIRSWDSRPRLLPVVPSALRTTCSQQSRSDEMHSPVAKRRNVLAWDASPNATTCSSQSQRDDMRRSQRRRLPAVHAPDKSCVLSGQIASRQRPVTGIASASLVLVKRHHNGEECLLAIGLPQGRRSVWSRTIIQSHEGPRFRETPHGSRAVPSV